MTISRVFYRKQDKSAMLPAAAPQTTKRVFNEKAEALHREKMANR